MDIKSEVVAAEERIKDAGLTVEQLCKRAKIHRATWQRWKAGATNPTLVTWRRVTAVIERVAA